MRGRGMLSHKGSSLSSVTTEIQVQVDPGLYLGGAMTVRL